MDSPFPWMMESNSFERLLSCVWSFCLGPVSDRFWHKYLVPGHWLWPVKIERDESTDETKWKLLVRHSIAVITPTMTVRAPRWYCSDNLISPQTRSVALVMDRVSGIIREERTKWKSRGGLNHRQLTFHFGHMNVLLLLVTQQRMEKCVN